MDTLLHAEETYQIRGAAYDVYHRLGPRHPEATFEEAMKVALRRRGIAVRDQVLFAVMYEDAKVGTYRPDLLAYETILVELKVVPVLQPIHEAQVLSYLRVTGLPVALLINFGARDIQMERRVLTQIAPKAIPPERNRPYAGGLEHLPFPELLWAIGSCVKRVHFTLGPGFLFHVYEKALYVEMGLQGLPREALKHLDVIYGGEVVGQDRVHSIVVGGKVLVLPLAVTGIERPDLMAARKQLDALGLQLALVVNFHDTVPRTRVVRVIPRTG